MQAFLLVTGEFLKKYWLYIVAFIGGLLLWRFLFKGRDGSFGVPTYPIAGATISKEEARSYANRMYIAMESFGTDEEELDRIYASLSINAWNVRSVYNEFNVRPYASFGSPLFGFGGTDTDLKGWLKNELSSSAYSKWDNLFNLAGIR